MEKSFDDFDDAVNAWRQFGGVLRVRYPVYKSGCPSVASWSVGPVLEGEDWREECKRALEEGGWKEDQITAEVLEF